MPAGRVLDHQKIRHGGRAQSHAPPLERNHKTAPSCHSPHGHHRDAQKIGAYTSLRCAHARVIGSDGTRRKEDAEMRKFCLFLIRFYQNGISPYLGSGKCRFQPTCSEYAMEAFRTLPLWKAFTKTLWRILRCNPFCKGGYDPL